MTLLFTLFVGAPEAQHVAFEEPLAIAELSERSETVVLGEVTAVWVESREGTPWTVASVLVERTLAGEADRLTQVAWPGGSLGMTELLVSGAPEVHPGDRVIFFVQADGRPAGMAQGMLHAESDDFVWRDLSGFVYGDTTPEGPEAWSLPDLQRQL